MALDLSATALLASIRRRGGLPATATTGTADSDLVRLINEELQLRLTAEILGAREEYFVQTKDYSISASTQRYRISSRAIGNKVRSVHLVSTTGEVSPPLTRTDQEHRHEFNGGSEPKAYLIEGNDIVLVPGSTSSVPTLRVKFFLRPAEVSASVTPATFATVNLSTGACTTTGNHGFTTSSSIDLLSASPGNEVTALALTPTAASGTSITFTASQLPQTLAAGDKLVAADTCSVAQIPSEYHPVLAQRVAVVVLDSLGKKEEAAAATKELEAMEAHALTLISPRADSSPRKIYASRGVLGPGGRLGRLLLGGD